ncbi:unnamed protein product, partial [Brassica oleracea]
FSYCDFKKARIRAHTYFYLFYTIILYTMSGTCEDSLACSTCHVIVMYYKNDLKNQQMMRMICLILLSGS